MSTSINTQQFREWFKTEFKNGISKADAKEYDIQDFAEIDENGDGKLDAGEIEADDDAYEMFASMCLEDLKEQENTDAGKKDERKVTGANGKKA